MGTTFTSSNQFRKGSIGERLVNEWLIKQGYVPYSPDVDKRHPFDRLVATPDKKKIFVADVKTKPSRIFYRDTGINLRHYEDYRRVMREHNMDVFLFFVDEREKQVYGNFLSVLEQPRMVASNPKKPLLKLQYPLISRNEADGVDKIYFPLEAMHPIAHVPTGIAAILKSLTQSSYGDASYE